MNKLIIPIIIIAVIALGIGVFFVLQKPAFPEPQIGGCGDSICDEFEKKNSNVCPKDCQSTIQSSSPPQSTPSKQTPEQSQTKPPISEQPIKITKSQEQINRDSPFGFFNPYEVLISDPGASTYSQINDYLKDLGVKWGQPMPAVSLLDEFIKSGLNVYSRALPMPGNPPNFGSDYENNLRDLVKKYKNQIKYWEADTEPSGVTGWKNYPDKYAEFLKITYKIVKEECGDCKIVFGELPGDFQMLNENSSSVKFLDTVLKVDGAKYFDVFGFKQHHHTIKDYPKLIKNKMDVYGGILSKYGINVKNIPVFIEAANYDGSPSDPFAGKFESQSEKEQAAGEVKLHVYALAQGIDKIFRNQIIESVPGKIGKEGGVFQYYGLVNNPSNDGQSHKKLTYYTYKKMVEILEGSDWNNIQTIQESDGVYIYKFTKNNKPIWVAWNDNSGQKTVEIAGIGSGSVQITEAVPKYETGKDVADYNTAFNIETKSANGGKITITLTDKPVFAEEK